MPASLDSILIKGFFFTECSNFMLCDIVFSIPADEYYKNIDSSAIHDELKQQLHDLINPSIVLIYDEIWTAFEGVDKYLPGYPCDSNSSHIPHVYSPLLGPRTPGGECGNYKKADDCFNREHLWPKSWFSGFDAGENARRTCLNCGHVNGVRGDFPLCVTIKSTVS